jgi:hypothetical protein
MQEARIFAHRYKLETLVIGNEVFVREPILAGKMDSFCEVMNTGEIACAQRAKGCATDYDAMLHDLNASPNKIALMMITNQRS